MDLFANVARLSAVSHDAWQQVMSLGAPRTLQRHEYFSQAGEAVTHFAFVTQGLVRHYYVDTGGRESVKAFRGQGEFTAPYAELIQGRPSRTFIQALVTTELITFDYARFGALAENSLELQRLWRRLAELHFVTKEQREYEFLQLTAEERYRRFREEFPEHHERVPLHQVASYIGITPVALSRIRARKR